MKVLKSVMFAAVMAIGLNSNALVEATGAIVKSKAVELGVHRIERLVTLKKIDASFLTELSSLKIESTTENAATYKVYGYLQTGVDGTALSLTIWMDAQGKTLNYVVNPGTKSSTPFIWPAKEAASLMEEGLHFVIEGWVKHPEVKVFYTGLSTIVMTPIKDAQGNLLAQFTVKSDDTAQILTINLKADGTFVSYEVK